MMIAAGEHKQVEFKSTMRWNLQTGTRDRRMDKAIAKTLGGFMNTEGGILIIGVGDDGQIIGLSYDFHTLAEGHQNVDGFETAFSDIVKNYLELGYRQHIGEVRFVSIEGKIVCAVQVEKSLEPVYCLLDNQRCFFARVGNSTRQLDAKDTVEYARAHFGS
jgi:predicted HTH transcriptional regulator